MSFKKNLIISVLLVIIMMCCISTISAEDLANTTLTNTLEDNVGIDENINDISMAEDNDMVVEIIENDTEIVSDNGDLYKDNYLKKDDDTSLIGEEIVNSTIYVDSKYTGDFEDGSEENPYKSISSAISNSIGNNVTFFLKNGNYTESGIDLPDKILSFVGESENGVIVSSQSTSYLFTANLNNKDLSFCNLIFKNPGKGYALNIAGNGNLNIMNCVFDGFYSGNNNFPSFKIDTTSSTITNSKIVNISSNNRNSGAGFILFNSGIHTIENTLIEDSVGSTRLNVGIFNVATTAVLEMNNVSVYNTKIAMSMIKNSGKVKIKNSNFIGNTLMSGDALLYNNAGDLTIESCVILDNSGFYYLIYETGANSVVSINNSVMDNNRYYSSLLRTAGTNHLNFNYWGTNDKPNSVVDYWVISNVSIAKNVDKVDLTADFTKYTDGNNVYDLEKLLPEFAVSFKSSNLTLNEKIYTKDGIASAKFTSNGDFQVSVGSVTFNLGDIYVDSNFNGTELGTETNPYKTISKAVSEATGWETIHIKNGNYTEENPITLINSLIFQGESKEGVIIRGGSKGLFNNPFFMTKTMALSFSYLTIKDIVCSGNNAPLSIGTYVSELTINNCIFENCTSQYGSMNIGSHNAAITNCQIKDSKSTSTFSSAIYFNNNGTFTIKNVDINGVKSIEASSDGVIVCKNNGTSITVENVVINDVYNTNSVINSNGDLYILYLTIKNVELSNSSNSNNAVLMINKDSSFNAESISISDINAPCIFYFGENVKIEKIAYTDISNVNSGVVLNIGDNASTTKYIQVSISDVNSTEIFKLGDDTSITSSTTTISNVNSEVIFNIGNNSNFISNLNYYISNVNCSYVAYIGADSGITFEQGGIAYSNIYKSIFYNSDNSSSTIANYNSFVYNNYSKVFNDKGSYNFEYNWWGTNEKPNDYVKNWALMTVSVSKKDTVTVRVYFNKFTDGNNTFDLDKSILTRMSITVITSTGNYNGTVVYGGSEASASFAYSDNEYVNITSDKATITFSLLPATYYVDSNFNGTSLGTKDNPFKSLSSALSVVGSKDIVFIKNGTYSLSSYSSATFIGESKENVIISLTGNGRLSIGGSSEKSFINLTFKSTKANIYLDVRSTKVNFNNCNFVDFKSDRLFNVMDRADLTIDNCNFSDITLSKGYLIYHVGNNYKDNLTIKNTIFNNIQFSNTAQALFYLNSINKIECDNVTISNSYLKLQNGLFYTNAKDVQIKNSKIINNEIMNIVGFYGIFTFQNGENFLIESSIIVNNSCNSNLIASSSNGKMNLTNNVILDNSYTNLIKLSGECYFDNNWWGTNERISEYVNQWAILSADISPDVIAGESTNITVSITKYITKDGVIGDLPCDLPVDGTEVNITSPSGEVTTAVLKDGKFTFPYTTTANNNTFHIKSGDVEFDYTVPLKILKVYVGDNFTATEDANITILAPGLDDSIDLIIDGVKESIQIVDGKAVKTIENIKAGTHSVVAIYIDNGILDFDSKSFVADKIQTEINLEDVTVNVGETVPVEFTIASDATGRVFIDVSGKKSIEYLEDGSLSIDLDLAIGNYTVTLYYGGDGKYDACDDSFKITVNGFNADLKANASDIKVGENAVIDIEINENATGATNVILGDLIIPVIFIDGKATVSIPDLANGTYTATVKFAGDSIFLAAETTVTFIVSKEELPSDINITIDIPEGTTAPEFTVNLPSDATGDFSVTIDNQTYSQPLVNGSATVKVPEQTPGNHTVSTAYTGDGKYDGFTSPNSTFNVPKASIPGGENALNMTTPSDSATPSYSIKLPADAKGNLTVTVDGKDTYSKELVNGSATVTVPELPAGKHNITVTYSGDAKYSSISKNTTVNVPEKAKPAPAKTTKVATKITAKNKKFKASKKVKKYTITLKAKGKPVKKVWVTLKVKGKTYKAKTNAKGKATFKIKKLTKKGKYKATIKFAGNKNYMASSKKVKITIK